MIKKWLNQGIQRPFGTWFAYEVSAGAIVFRTRKDGVREYLLLRYRNGHWDYVKGHVEDGETHTGTVQREAYEEALIRPLRVLKGFHLRSHYYYTAKTEERLKREASNHGTHILKTVHFYIAEAKPNAKTEIPVGSHEHRDCAWLPYDKAYPLVTFPRSKEILAKAEQFLNSGRERVTMK